MVTIQILFVLCFGVLLTEALIPLPDEFEPSRDPCVNFRCRNGGECVAPADIPRCVCRAGFTGRFCEINTGPIISRDPCANFQCHNGGSCVAPADRPRCSCRSGFTGRHCEEKIDVRPICGPCPRGWTCNFTPDVLCVKAPCSAFTCRPPVFLDSCGGCPPGKKCRTFYPPCAPPPRDCELDGILMASMRHRRSPCHNYRCDPVHVCM